MLPSTGYFKGINCPFYASGLCERPYCHFRHVKKESQATSNDGIESGAILQKLVSAAVQKVLQQAETTPTTLTDANTADTVVDVDKTNNAQLVPKATYNPTPISELNKISTVDSEDIDEIVEQRKKHIPVPYTPRKPASIPIKRPVETNGSSKPFVYIPPPVKYTPGCTETVPLDQYTPKGSSESCEKYLPGSETELQEYTPKETQTSSKRNYVPSDKNVNKKKILEYKPAKVSTKSEVSPITYQPTLRSLVPCFSSDEEEPNIKKRKLSNDLNGLDDLGPEFDILDQILDEEKPVPEIISESVICGEISINKETNKKSDNCDNKTEKGTSSSQEKLKSNKNRKEKSASHKDKYDHKSNKSLKKSHKSSSKDKIHEEKQEKCTEQKKHSSKTSHRSTKHSENTSSKNFEKHSSSSKSDSKQKHKSNHHKSHKRSKETKHRHQKGIPNSISDNDSVHTADDAELGQNDEELYDASESDEETIALECKRIFEEYVPKEKTATTVEGNISLDNDNENEYIPSKKRVSRTTGKDIKVLPKPTIKPNYKVNAAQTMTERLGKIRDYHASKNSLDTNNSESNITKSDVSKSTFNSPTTGNSKIRIAHVPYASTLVNAKKVIPPNVTHKKDEPSTSSTVIQTIRKGTQRVAHMPNEKFIDRPGVLEPLASKIPANIRSTYLNMMIDECLKIYLSAVDAYARAQHEELNTSKKCSTVQIYKNSAVLTISRLRKELQECNGIKKAELDYSTFQKIPQTISGKTGYAGSWSIESKNRRIVDNSQEFSGAKFYTNIKKWILTEQQLQENGFPRPHASRQKGRAIIYGQNRQKPPEGHIRTCCRCKKSYSVDKKGFPAIKEECIYHPNNKYRVRGEARYQCCSQDTTSDGCCIAPCHVYEYVNYEDLKGYVRTLSPETTMENYGVYSLDCEMCYTTHGLDLTRVTVINSSCKVVYETLVKPLHPIIDYNTRYSGITEEQMANVTTTLLEVQATLLAMFNSKTILIGHSLESDFKALKLIHDTVVDTSVLFPHKMGPPFKRALRNLCSEHLKKIIQNSVDGHDSAEDATVCMELIIYKLKEDLKTR